MFFDRIIDDALLEILTHHSSKELAIDAQVCKRWNAAVKKPNLWRMKLQKEFFEYYTKLPANPNIDFKDEYIKQEQFNNLLPVHMFRLLEEQGFILLIYFPNSVSEKNETLIKALKKIYKQASFVKHKPLKFVDDENCLIVEASLPNSNADRALIFFKELITQCLDRKLCTADAVPNDSSLYKLVFGNATLNTKPNEERSPIQTISKSKKKCAIM